MARITNQVDLGSINSLHNSINDSKITDYHIRVRPSCLAKVCVPCLGTLGDTTLLLHFCANETLPPVWGAVKGCALVHSRILCSMDPQPKQAPVTLQQSPLCSLPQWEQQGTSCPLEAPCALTTDGAGRIVSLPVA